MAYQSKAKLATRERNRLLDLIQFCADERPFTVLNDVLAEAKAGLNADQIVYKLKITKTVKNLLSGEEMQIAWGTPSCCDPSSETYWSM